VGITLRVTIMSCSATLLHHIAFADDERKANTGEAGAKKSTQIVRSNRYGAARQFVPSFLEHFTGPLECFLFWKTV
jgi:hypothetical protein